LSYPCINSNNYEFIELPKPEDIPLAAPMFYSLG
jgi:hypothetical protein